MEFGGTGQLDMPRGVWINLDWVCSKHLDLEFQAWSCLRLGFLEADPERCRFLCE